MQPNVRMNKHGGSKQNFMNGVYLWLSRNKIMGGRLNHESQRTGAKHPIESGADVRPIYKTSFAVCQMCLCF